MKRFGVLIILLVTMGFGCMGCYDDEQSENDAMRNQIMLQIQQQQAENANIPTNSILDDLEPYSITPDDTTLPPEESILNDLTPTNASNLITSLWVKETNLDVTSSGSDALWQIQIVFGTDTAFIEEPAAGVDVTVEFRGISSEKITGTTDDEGWVTWKMPKPAGAVEMYIIDITGEYPWNTLDRAYAETVPAASITAEQLQ